MENISKEVQMERAIDKIHEILHMINPRKAENWVIFYKKTTDENIYDFTEWQREYFQLHTGAEYILIFDNANISLLYVVDVTACSTLCAMESLMKVIADKF